MPRPGSRTLASLLGAILALIPAATLAQQVAALPDQTSHVRLSNRDLNHIVCVGGDVEDVKFSAEKGLSVERGGPDAWIKFLVKEVEDMGAVARSYVTAPSEFFVTCNGAVYPLYAEPSDIPAQTITLVPGSAQRARSNEALLGPLVEEERAVSITLALLQDRVPSSFSEVAPRKGPLLLASLPDARLVERRRLAIDGSGLSASEYGVTSTIAAQLDERHFLDSGLGPDIFAVTLDRLALQPGVSARLIIVRRGARP